MKERNELYGVLEFINFYENASQLWETGAPTCAEKTDPLNADKKLQFLVLCSWHAKRTIEPVEAEARHGQDTVGSEKFFLLLPSLPPPPSPYF